MDNRFVFVTARQEQFNWLSDTLTGVGVLIWDKGDLDALLQLIGSIGVRIVFLDFEAESVARSSDLAEKLLKVYPSLWLVGVGSLDSGAGILAAMRAGAREFIQDSAAPAQVKGTVQKLVQKAPPLPAAPRGKLAALLGARPGVGTSMAAVHLALALKTELVRDEEVLLLDFGFPQGDVSLYLDTKLMYSFTDAVRSVRRFDHALIKTAFVRHKSGLAVLQFPHNVAEMQEVLPVEVLNLLALLKFYFKYIVADLGGFMGTDFLLHVLGVADQTMLACEQTVPSCHSAHQLLRRLEERGYDHRRIGLLVAKHDPKIGMTPRQIAKLLDLEWRANLPNRPYPLIACANEGRSMLEMYPKDPYLKEIRMLAQELTGTPSAKEGIDGSGLAGLLARIKQGLGRGES